MKTIGKLIKHLENYICIFTLIVMLTLTFVNVISRFGFHMSLSFTEEIVTGLFVLASLSGASIAIRDGAHLGLDFITFCMPKPIQKVLSILANLLGMVFCGIVFYYGVMMVHQEFITKQISATMQWPEWIYGCVVPLGALLLIVRYLITLFQTLSKRGATGA